MYEASLRGKLIILDLIYRERAEIARLIPATKPRADTHSKNRAIVIGERASWSAKNAVIAPLLEFDKFRKFRKARASDSNASDTSRGKAAGKAAEMRKSDNAPRSFDIRPLHPARYLPATLLAIRDYPNNRALLHYGASSTVTMSRAAEGSAFACGNAIPCRALTSSERYLRDCETLREHSKKRGFIRDEIAKGLSRHALKRASFAGEASGIDR